MFVNQRKLGSRGFTILELMIAASIFTVVLLVIAVGAIRFTQAYYKGINSSKAQATARAISDQLSQSIRFGHSITQLTSGSFSGICIDNTLYAYQIGQEVIDNTPNPAQHQGYHGLVMSSGANCSSGIPGNILTALAAPGTPNLPSGTYTRELLGPHMRLADLSVSGSGNLYTIRVKILYGEDDLFFPAVTGSVIWANEQCANTIGSQYCATSDLTTTVEQRLQ